MKNFSKSAVLIILFFLLTSCATKWVNDSISNLPDYQIQQIFASDKLYCDQYSDERSDSYCKSLFSTINNTALSKLSALSSCLSYKNLLFNECMEAKGWKNIKE